MKLKDETGHRYGILTVVCKNPSPVGKTISHWMCKCDCGNYTVARADHLRAGHKRSCGCMRGKKIND